MWTDVVSFCAFSFAGATCQPFRSHLVIFHYQRNAARLQQLFQTFREKDGIHGHYFVSPHIGHHEIRKDEIEFLRVFDEGPDGLLAALLHFHLQV